MAIEPLAPSSPIPVSTIAVLRIEESNLDIDEKKHINRRSIYNFTN